ncbi:darobactin family peptide antibiotic [Yersinia pekkanenii]|uniref:No significant database hits n=1 Tax=Yersinia pekkanenii TaxID=1288385 RepID=A0A0T9QMU7_9GAMM|nr:darobactin family peptide antibiotic [Yersinia pekkanenii]CNI19078.1 no significant database hits [Yersinia pekkanenii]CRY64896.1 no significant database hits [Yersinia pekkanenii]
MNLSEQSDDKKTNHDHLMALKGKLQSLEKSFKNNALYISDCEIEKIKNNTLRRKITAWNWSRSFAE